MGSHTFKILISVLWVAVAAVLAPTAGAERKTSRDALREATLHGNIAVIRQLVAQGVDLNDGCPIVAAIKKDDDKTVSAMLALGAKVDCKGSPDAFPDHTPLNMALVFPRVRTARVLVAHGADVNAIPESTSRSDLSPLLIAIFDFHKIQEAERQEWLILLDEMIARGANLHTRDKYGLSSIGIALTVCPDVDSAPMVSLLLKHGVDPNELADSGSNHPLFPLELAIISRCSKSTVRTLLEAGANPIIRGDATRLTELARGRKDSELIALLRQYGAADTKKSGTD
jgi:ankyrin repeat protein